MFHFTKNPGYQSRISNFIITLISATPKPTLQSAGIFLTPWTSEIELNFTCATAPKNISIGRVYSSDR